ncbi:MAG: aspartyl-tRNA(Asn)/glutamyl-tRNA (Gln) amidotransferase subunit C [Parcubacteria group bacterium Gr01-1014_3]|nr:MAG: aspartyl-tRNA(Asn)/glutamyl-tRNA (Gln) amidotransferase subunit C [Parcubacteria group bacterium Gr01-1014_3]
MDAINKKSLEHLADLARIHLDEKKEEKLLHDLQNILNHFQELQALNTEGVLPMTGGTDLKNIFREDAVRERLGAEEVVDAFPDKQNRHLKVPPVFE